jgi:hypothetical protein
MQRDFQMIIWSEWKQTHEPKHVKERIQMTLRSLLLWDEGFE